jgi:hypothetical protein
LTFLETRLYFKELWTVRIDVGREEMAIFDKSKLSSFRAATAPSSDSIKAREFVRDSYKKAGGRPTTELERVYGEYLEYVKYRSKTGPRKD